MLCLGFPVHVSAHKENSFVVRRLTERIAVSPNNAKLYLARAEMSRLSQHWHVAAPDYERAGARSVGDSLPHSLVS
jgi:hypothetical protein